MIHSTEVDGSPVARAGETIIVVIGGDRLDPGAVATSPSPAFVIAADSGVDHALAAGLLPDLVVGDFDSLSDKGLDWARTNAIQMEEHPPDKDLTDTELALRAAVRRGAEHIVMLSGGGDRLDHSIAAITALGHPSLAGCRSVSARWGNSLVQVVHGPRTLCVDLPVGATFSVLALHGGCTGVRLTGARWPLDNAAIAAGSGLGVSNVAVASQVTVAVDRGVLTVIVPHHDASIGGRSPRTSSSASGCSVSLRSDEPKGSPSCST